NRDGVPAYRLSDFDLNRAMNERDNGLTCGECVRHFGIEPRCSLKCRCLSRLKSDWRAVRGHPYFPARGRQ
ncbi:hypothetical protein, partial [Enterobacter hormaechei]|uniref:hypothetical protein n=2 Tax=Enterobacter hormaechei TaxID=158836 RepID=UPI001C7CD042